MTDQIKEQMSAFLDGELPSSESSLLVRRLSREREIHVAAGRYLLIGEAMRGASSGERAGGPTRGFADRVMAAIEAESLRENAPKENLSQRATANVGRLNDARRASAARWLKTGGGLAIAASIGAAAVLLVQLPPAGQIKPITAATVKSSGNPAVVAAMMARDATLADDPVSSNSAMQPGPLMAGQLTTRPDDMGIREVPASYSNGRLTNYVVAHSEYSLPLGRRNVLTGLLAEDADLQEKPSGAAAVSWSTR